MSRKIIDVVEKTAKNYLDEKELELVKVDFVKEGLNQKLVFVNPNQTGQCGCGESFTVND